MARECKAVALMDCIEVTVPYDRNTMMKIIGARWAARLKCWHMPLNPQSVKALLSVAGMQLDETLRAMAERLPVQESAADRMPVNMSMNKEMPVTVKPFAHQIKAYHLGLATPDVALLMEMGCGKTVTAIGIAGRRYLDHQIDRVLVVCPVSVISVWVREFKEMAGYNTNVIAPDGASKDKALEITAHRYSTRPGLNIVVINYESSWRDAMLDALTAYRPDMVICDESQRIKTHNSKQSRAMQQVGALASYRLALTGTPVMNSPLDFWAQYRFLNGEIFEPSFYAHKARHAVTGGYEDKQIVGYRDLDVLVRKAHSIASRVTKAQALDLPETLDVRVTVRLEPTALRTYNQIRTDMIATLGAQSKVTAPHVITRMLRLSQITGGFVNDDDGNSLPVSTAKLMALRDELEDLIDSGRKVVIFARFRAEIQAIRQCAAEIAGPEAVRMIWGDTTMEDRGRFVKEFQTDPTVMVFVAQIATAGLGITLTAASTAIFYSCDYSYANHEQAKARIHRIGQKNACTYIYLVAEATVDEEVLLALQSKKSMAALVVDNWRQLLEKGGRAE